MSEWIAVEDELPTKQVEVVFYTNPFEWWSGMYTPADLYGSDGEFQYHQHWGDDGYHAVNNVTHWMPLPTPPAPKEYTV
jgi:hypothetical protein